MESIKTVNSVKFGGAEKKLDSLADTHILHVDMDAFFASVEQLDFPNLRGRPVLVSGLSERSVVSAASYEARKFGVHSAMPVGQALRRCPQAIVQPVRMERYRQLSAQIMAIFREITPKVEPLSIDEAFLDVRSVHRLYGSSLAIAQILRKRIRSEVGVPASVGVAATKHVAKIASDQAKPDGLLVVPAAQTIDFLNPLPISALWGVGAKTQEILQQAELKTIGEIAHCSIHRLQRLVGKMLGAHIWRLANGIDDRSVQSRAEKSISQECTFKIDEQNPQVVIETILQQAHFCARQLRKHHELARCVSIKVRLGNFQTFTRSRTLPVAVNVGDVISKTARSLYEQFMCSYSLQNSGCGVRLVGVRVSSLCRAEQELLFDFEDSGRQLAAEEAVDKAVEKFGKVITVGVRRRDTELDEKRNLQK